MLFKIPLLKGGDENQMSCEVISLVTAIVCLLTAILQLAKTIK